MNLPMPKIKSYEEQAVDTVTFVLNKAIFSLGSRATLKQLAETRSNLTIKPKLLINFSNTHLAQNFESFLVHAIEKDWNLTNVLMYHINYMDTSEDETSKYYYYEVVFSQPTVKYPIPQATVSVFFRLCDNQLEKPYDPTRPKPKMTFRIEGQHQDHDVRFVKLTEDWILATLKMKLKFFERIEGIRLF